MTFKEFKELPYSDYLPIEYILQDLLFKGRIDFMTIIVSYVRALEREKHMKDSLFNEAATVIRMALSGNWKKSKDKASLIKRAIHITNLNTTLPAGIYDKKYGYTEEDKKEWDSFCDIHYGVGFNIDNN